MKVVVGVIVGLLVAGCSSPAPETVGPVSSPSVEASPTPTPSPSPELTVKRALKVLKRARLPLGVVKIYTARTDPNELLRRPGQYIAKANFQDTRLQVTGLDPHDADGPEIDQGGSLEVFRLKAHGRARARYIKSLAQSGSLFAEYDYLIADGLLLLRLSPELVPSQAKKYRAALVEVFGP